MKRILSVILAVSMLFCMGSVAFAETDLALKLTASDATLTAGETVTVDVSFVNNPGITGSVIDITYDAEILTLVSVEKGALLENAFFASKSDVLGAICVDFAAGSAMTGDAAVCTLTFTVVEDAELGTTALTASTDDTTDGAVNPAQLTVADGTLALEIVDYLWGDVNDDGVADGIDAVLIMQYAAGTLAYEDLPQPKAADTDGNSVIDGVDAVLIMQYAAGTYDPAA